MRRAVTANADGRAIVVASRNSNASPVSRVTCSVSTESLGARRARAEGRAAEAEALALVSVVPETIARAAGLPRAFRMVLTEADARPCRVCRAIRSQADWAACGESVCEGFFCSCQEEGEDCSTPGLECCGGLTGVFLGAGARCEGGRCRSCPGIGSRCGRNGDCCQQLRCGEEGVCCAGRGGGCRERWTLLRALGVRRRARTHVSRIGTGTV